MLTAPMPIQSLRVSFAMARFLLGRQCGASGRRARDPCLFLQLTLHGCRACAESCCGMGGLERP